jgi:predicted protein tyrosine phosphatase
MDGLGEIEIFGRNSAIGAILWRRKYWHVVSVRDSREHSAVDQFSDLTLGFLPVPMDDIWEKEKEKPGLVELPSESVISGVLDWAKGRTPLLFHCGAGVSRSPALAYLVACMRVRPEVAIGLLNVNRHYPNRHVIEVGARILQDPEIVSVVEREIWNRGGLDGIVRDGASPEACP